MEQYSVCHCNPCGKRLCQRRGLPHQAADWFAMTYNQGLQDHGDQIIGPVGEDTSAQAADGMEENGSAGEEAAFQAVHHGNVGA